MAAWPSLILNTILGCLCSDPCSPGLILILQQYSSAMDLLFSNVSKKADSITPWPHYLSSCADMEIS